MQETPVVNWNVERFKWHPHGNIIKDEKAFTIKTYELDV